MPTSSLNPNTDKDHSHWFLKKFFLNNLKAILNANIVK